MSEESKVADPAKAADEVPAESQAPTAEIESGDEHDEAPAGPPAAGAAAKKKKSKKKRIKAAMGMGGSTEASGSGQREQINKAVSGLSKAQLSELLKMNPALANELDGAQDP